MRPLTLAERGVGIPTVSLAGLLGGDRPALSGTTAIRLDTYVAEILTGGFPGMRNPIPRSWRAAIDGYLDNIVEVDLPEVGIEVRHPGTLRRWMTAYAAATATATAYDRIRDAATAGESQKPAKTTTIAYREALERVWLLEPLEAKLSETVDDHDVAHLRWLQRRLGGQLLDAVVVTTGRHAYRRRDGIGVVPLSLLDP